MKDMQQFLETENQKAVIQQAIAKLTEQCFEKCIGKPGTKLDLQANCVANCAGRYLDSSVFIVNRMMAKRSKANVLCRHAHEVLSARGGAPSSRAMAALRGARRGRHLVHGERMHALRLAAPSPGAAALRRRRGCELASSSAIVRSTTLRLDEELRRGRRRARALAARQQPRHGGGVGARRAGHRPCVRKRADAMWEARRPSASR